MAGRASDASYRRNVHARAARTVHGDGGSVKLDKRATMKPDNFQEVRAPDSGKLVCEYNPTTHEVRVVKRNGSTLVAPLPIKPTPR